MKKFLATTLAIGILTWASSAMATPISDITVPTLGVTFNSISRDFIISGFSSSVAVGYEDSTQEAYFGSFVLGTTGLNSVISNQGKTITYTVDSSTGMTGKVDLVDVDDSYSELIIGSLVSLEMTVINPVLGLFEGLGFFSVMGGSLASDFGDSGGIASVGLSFNMPLDFYSSFAGIANTRLYPETQAPEPSTILLMGSGLLGLVGYNRKRFSKKS